MNNLYFLGIDIGSATSKGVVTQNGELLVSHLLPSGVNYRATAEKLREKLLAEAELSSADITSTVATGQGATNVELRNQRVTDILCCARAINRLFPSVRTIIDVQAQSSQVIRLSDTGQVTNFVVSEKCAAGSGRFLEIIANVLQIDLNEIGPLSLRSKNPVTFTTSCAVFGESEAISRVAEGYSKEDILAGVHQALADKIAALVDRVGLEKDCVLTGGGALDIGLVQSVAEKLAIKLLVPPQPQLVTAFGAALMAVEMGKDRPKER